MPSRVLAINILNIFLVNLIISNILFYKQCFGLEEVLPICESDIYCKGELLDRLQMAEIFKDSKTFVDKKLRFPMKQVLQNYHEHFNNYSKNNKDSLGATKHFLRENFEDGGELEVWNPPDWHQSPIILNSIADPKLRKWAFDLNGLWKNLSRKMSDHVETNPEFYSLIHVPHGFIIPGGRFKELYYWDTFWIVNGLLLCGMQITAKGVIENLLHLVKKLGHVPNGSRVYYRERTQPPMLTLMVDSYYKNTRDFNFIKENIKILDKEMDYWLNTRSIKVPYNGETYTLFRYFAPSVGPRPESYREDIETANKAGAKDENDRFMVYTSLKSAAESGWDFSSRWFIKDGTNDGELKDISTQNIIPVDLNALLHRDFLLLMKWHTKLGNTEMAMKYHRLATSLLNAIEKVLWNEKARFWLDYDILNNKPRDYFYLSNFVPLWTKSYTFHPNEITKDVLNYISRHNLQSYPGGVPTSMVYSGEQWDFPNVWPPLQAFLIQGLDQIGTHAASETAYFFASRWVLSNYIGYQATQKMFEKYDALHFGVSGGGGEYEGQTGFGWTNGLIFELLKRWGTEISTQGLH